MAYENIINKVIETQKIRKELCKVGLCGNMVGPTGPTARCNKSSIYIFKW